MSGLKKTLHSHPSMSFDTHNRFRIHRSDSGSTGAINEPMPRVEPKSGVIKNTPVKNNGDAGLIRRKGR